MFSDCCGGRCVAARFVTTARFISKVTNRGGIAPSSSFKLGYQYM